MKIVITGGSGFLGQRLARELLMRDQLSDAQSNRGRIHELGGFYRIIEDYLRDAGINLQT
jgi:nucleoside-diphosphate-sugar epimerase